MRFTILAAAALSGAAAVPAGTAVIDDITFGARAVAARGVPEPAAGALMLGGFSLVGGAVRRRTGLVIVAA